MDVIVESNADAWAEKLARVLDGFGFASQTASGPLGDATVDRLARAISDRGLGQSRGFDGDFAANEDEYLKEKVKTYGAGAARPNVRTEQMLSVDSVAGEHSIGADGKELRWRYGKGTAPASARTAHDRETTDRRKARYAHEGQSEKKVKRPFFGLVPEDHDAARELAEDALERHLKSK